ncbi:MAG: hypothetical protein ABIH20_04800 [Candidatus Diapherotrites archaeon]
MTGKKIEENEIQKPKKVCTGNEPKKGLSIGELAKSLNFGKTFTLKRLIKMEKQGLIERDGRVALNRSYMWKVKAEVNNG